MLRICRDRFTRADYPPPRLNHSRFPRLPRALQRAWWGRDPVAFAVFRQNWSADGIHHRVVHLSRPTETSSRETPSSSCRKCAATSRRPSSSGRRARHRAAWVRGWRRDSRHHDGTSWPRNVLSIGSDVPPTTSAANRAARGFVVWGCFWFSTLKRIVSERSWAEHPYLPLGLAPRSRECGTSAVVALR